MMYCTYCAVPSLFLSFSLSLFPSPSAITTNQQHSHEFSNTAASHCTLQTGTPSPSGLTCGRKIFVIRKGGPLLGSSPAGWSVLHTVGTLPSALRLLVFTTFGHLDRSSEGN
jgi:hypothetical protein